MRNFVTATFDDKGKAYNGLHALRQRDQRGEITVRRLALRAVP